MTDQQIKILEVLRFVNPILMFGIVLFALGWVLKVPLVLAVTIACLFAVVAFTVISVILSIQRKKR
jgi:hypothetical protein